MAEVKIMIGGRQYAVHCRDGEEDRLRQLAAMMSERVEQVTAGSPGLNEVRQLLFAGLLLADTLTDQQANGGAAPNARQSAPAAAKAQDDPAMLAALERLALRLEALGDSLAADLLNA